MTTNSWYGMLQLLEMRASIVLERVRPLRQNLSLVITLRQLKQLRGRHINLVFLHLEVSL
jgi:hypothetical protein